MDKRRLGHGLGIAAAAIAAAVVVAVVGWAAWVLFLHVFWGSVEL
jgi:hypothetical protein